MTAINDVNQRSAEIHSDVNRVKKLKIAEILKLTGFTYFVKENRDSMIYDFVDRKMIDIFDSQTKLGSMCENDAKLLLELLSNLTK
jgi:hypothetical protein